MSLKASYPKKEDIPAALVEFYKEQDGAWVLEVDGFKTQTDFDNYAEALKKRFTDQAADLSKKGGAGITREELLEALEKFVKPDGGDGGGDKGKGNGKGNGDLDARLHDLERTVASLTETNETLQTERDEALGNSRKTTIRNELNSAAQKAGATPEGISSLVTLVEPNFEVAQDGSVVTKLEAKGVSPNQKPTDFFSAAARDPQYRMFWGKSVGANADGDGAGPGAGDALGKGNPWSKAGWNMTEQGKLYQKDATEAGRLMDAAGVKLGATAPVR